MHRQHRILLILAAILLSSLAAWAAPPDFDALLERADRLAQEGNQKQAADIYKMLYAQSETTMIRVVALGALASANDPETPRILARALSDENRRVRQMALRLARESGGEETTKILASELKSLNQEQQILLLDALADRGDKTAIEAILPMADSENENIRVQTLEALGKLGDEKLLPLLAQRAAAPAASRTEQAAARLSLRALKGAGVEPRAIAMIQDEKIDADARAELILALGDRGAGAAVKPILQTAKHENETIRRASIASLGVVAGQDAIPSAVALLAKTSSADVRYVEKALLAMLRRSDEPQKFAPPLLREFETTRDEKIRLSFLKLMGVVGGRQSLQTLCAALRGDATAECEAAIRALSTWEGPEPMDDLLDTARGAKSEIHRVLALRGYIDLAVTQMDGLPDKKRLDTLETALKLATNDAEKKKALAGLSAIPSARALDMAVAQIANDALRQEAALAAIAVAEALPKADARKIAAAMEIVAKADIGEDAKKRAGEILENAHLGEGFKLHVINAESRFEAAGACDVNNDGKLDIFCGGFWYEAPSWKKHFVREVKEEGDYYYDFANLPVDLDGDGWVDIANAAWHDKMIFWLRNPGKKGGDWELIEIDKPANMETAILVDINGDGDLDLFPNPPSMAVWYEYKKDASAPYGVGWIRHDLPQEAAGHGNGAGDINGDGRCDIIGLRGWLEQTEKGEFVWRPEFDLGNAGIPCLVHDPDGDGDSDIIFGQGHNYGLAWLEQGKDAGGKRTWTRHEIDKSWSQPHFKLLADLDGDGEKELVTGKRFHAHNGKDPGGNDPKCVYYYKFSRESKTWTRHVMHENGEVAFGINTMAVDMDGDGDTDVIAPGKSGLYLFENVIK